MDFSKYQKNKAILRESILELKNIGNAIEMNDYSQNLENLLQQLEQTDFNVAVVGMFSRGKSTFVNALLGKRILPTSKKATTAVISKIVYKDTPNYRLYFKDDNTSPRELNEETFLSLTAPSSVDQNDMEQVKASLKKQDELDKIAYAEIGYPLSLCKNGIVLVDTPGMNDINTTRVEITYRYLNKADAIIMVLAANQLLSVSEVAFLKNIILSRQIKDIFYVINRKDTLNGADEENRVIEFAKTNLREIVPNDLEMSNIFLVSSYQALLYRRQENGEQLSAKQIMKLPENFLDTGFTEFEEALSNFLIHEKGRSKLQLQTFKIIEQANKMTATIDKLLHLSEISTDSIVATVNKLETELQKTKIKTQRIVNDLKVNLEHYMSYINNQCHSAGNEMLLAALNSVDSYQGNFNSDRLRQEINAAIEQKQQKFIISMESYQNTILQGELYKAQKRLKEVWHDVDVAYNESVNLPTVVENEDIDFITPSPKYISNNQTNIGSYAAGGVIGSLLAGAVLPALTLGVLAAWCFGFFDDREQEVKIKIKRQLSNKFSDIQDNIQHNVTSLYQSRILSLTDSIEDAINDKISEMQTQLQKALDEKNKKDYEQQEYRLMLKENRLKIIYLKEKLSAADFMSK